MDPSTCGLGLADADRKLSEARYAAALRELQAKKAEFPDLSSPLGLGGVQDVLFRQHIPLPGEGAAQDEVGGHAVIVAGPDNKGQSRLPDAVFIGGEEGLPLFPEPGPGGRGRGASLLR